LKKHQSYYKAKVEQWEKAIKNHSTLKDRLYGKKGWYSK
jgi:hypothetical protein